MGTRAAQDGKVLSQVLLRREWSLKRGCFCYFPFISVTLLNDTFSVFPGLNVKCPTNAFYIPRIFPGNVQAYHILQLLSFFMLPLKK